MDRRNFMKLGGAAGAGLLVPWNAGSLLATPAKAAATAGSGGPTGVSPALAKFVDALPIPGVYTPLVKTSAEDYYEISVRTISQKLHRDLPSTPVNAYGPKNDPSKFGFPSMSIEATVNKTVHVQWWNELADKHLLSGSIDWGTGYDPATIGTIDGHDYMSIWSFRPGMPFVDPAMKINTAYVSESRIVTHLHGAHVPWTSDGGPRGWYSNRGEYDPMARWTDASNATINMFRNIDTKNQPQNYADSYYPNTQKATTLWFHDHAMGITRINVYSGMAGFWILRDPSENGLRLPSGDYEIPIVFQDRTFNTDGSLFYPTPPEVPEFFGDTMLANGKVWPFLDVEPRKYRFRLLNGCNARFLRMRLYKALDNQGTLPTNTRYWEFGPKFNVIGNDGGLLDKPAAMQVVVQAPAERLDVVIDFTGLAGGNYLLYNDASAPFGNSADTKGSIPEVMLFRVKAKTGSDLSTLPASLVALKAFTSNDKTRTMTLDEITDSNHMLRQLINMRGYMMDWQFKHVTDDDNNPAAAGDLRLGNIETWNFANSTVDVHPIHIHQTMFRIVGRVPFDSKKFNFDRSKGMTVNPWDYVAPGATMQPPEDYESGWKDTIRCNPGWINQIQMQWLDYAGNYVMHCHILEHEEHDMMVPLIIKPALV